MLKALNLQRGGIIKGAVITALLAYTFYPTFLWMKDRWLAPDSYFGHGFLIPLVSLFWIFQNRKELAEADRSPHWAGLLILTAGVLLQIASSVLRIYFLSGFAFVLVLFGIIFFLFGMPVIKRVWYPILFLAFMIPLPLLMISQITLKMKFMISELAASCLTGIGLNAFREGSYLVMENSYLLVGDPCSGLRSFLSFLCLGFVFVYGSRMAPWKKIILVSSGLPFAVMSNLLRVFTLGFIAEVYGMKAVEGKVHDISGIVVFIIALMAFLVLRSILEGSNVERK